ncbi:MAG: hypothetical protein MSO56_06660 [Clostridiales bacterium]|nr:hypothetical protein [Clostridiales bacterium]
MDQALKKPRYDYIYSFAYKSSVKYKAEKIKRVPLDMQIADYDAMKAAAERAGEKVNQYIKTAIKQRMERDGK